MRPLTALTPFARSCRNASGNDSWNTYLKSIVLLFVPEQRNDTQSEDIEYQQYGQYRATRAQAWAPGRHINGRIPGMGGMGLDERMAMGSLSPEQARFPMENGINIKFEVPSAPVIFVLGEQTTATGSVHTLIEVILIIRRYFGNYRLSLPVSRNELTI